MVDCYGLFMLTGPLYFLSVCIFMLVGVFIMALIFSPILGILALFYFCWL